MMTDIRMRRYQKEVPYSRDMHIPSGCVALSKVESDASILSPVLLDESANTLYRLPEVPKLYFYLEANHLGMLSEHFMYPLTIESSAIYAYVVQISEEAAAAGAFICERAISVWRLLLSAAVSNRWLACDSEFHAICLGVWSDVVESRRLETLDNHPHGSFVMSEMFDLCARCVDDIDVTLLPRSDAERSPYWACLNYIYTENLKFCARLN